MEMRKVPDIYIPDENLVLQSICKKNNKTVLPAPEEYPLMF
ncbi:hypothetical protein J2772_003864 [Chryseobacterium jejuense]|nr:hypothetical protein [Chryseobacterium jejuense]